MSHIAHNRPVPAIVAMPGLFQCLAEEADGPPRAGPSNDIIVTFATQRLRKVTLRSHSRMLACLSQSELTCTLLHRLVE